MPTGREAGAGHRWIALVAIGAGLIVSACSETASVRQTNPPDVCVERNVTHLFGVSVYAQEWTDKCKDVGK